MKKAYISCSEGLMSNGSGRGGVSWSSQDRVTRGKAAGGLYFRDFECYNLALLAK